MSPRWPLLVTTALLAVARPAGADREAPDAQAMQIMFPIMADRFALQCAREAPMPAKLAVHLEADVQSRYTITTKATGKFVRCFLKLANETRGEGPFDHPPQAFDLSFHLTFTPPQQQLQDSVDTFVALGCRPRPGEVPTSATYDVSSNVSALIVHVATTPANAEVAACLDGKLRDWVSAFGPAKWDLKAHAELALPAPITNDWLGHIARDKAPAVATTCAPPPGGITHVELRVHAHPEDPELSVDAKADRGTKLYSACVAAALTPVLHAAVAVDRTLPDGTVEPYFRIVSDLDTTVTIDVPGVRP